MKIIFRSLVLPLSRAVGPACPGRTHHLLLLIHCPLASRHRLGPRCVISRHYPPTKAFWKGVGAAREKARREADPRNRHNESGTIESVQRRLDVWPVDDYGVRKGYALAYGLPDLLTPKQLQVEGERFPPYRTVAAWYWWRVVYEQGKPRQ